MDEFSHHEALDRAYLLADLFERQLANHTFVKGHPDLSAQCEMISAALGKLYQAIGCAKYEGHTPL